MAVLTMAPGEVKVGKTYSNKPQLTLNEGKLQIYVELRPRDLEDLLVGILELMRPDQLVKALAEKLGIDLAAPWFEEDEFRATLDQFHSQPMLALAALAKLVCSGSE